MGDKFSKFESELNELITLGTQLCLAVRYEFYADSMVRTLAEKHNGDEEKAKEELAALPKFFGGYQSWYSKASAVVKQVVPDRYNDFVAFYEPPKNRRQIDALSYTIRDYLQGLFITAGQSNITKVDGRVIIPKIEQQNYILKAAREALSSRLMDLKAILQADLFDSEINAARGLSKSGFLRASGAMCGVVIERHLQHVCAVHNLIIKKNHPTIYELIELLRENGVITVSDWRFIQSLADTRNLCDHAKGTEPTREEIENLLSGTDRVLKQIS